MLQKILWLSLAGACGTVSRYTLCVVAERTKVAPIPLGTPVVNIAGSFLFGLIYVLAEKRLPLGNETRLILLTGFLGAFTTFSAFAFETAKLLKSAQWGLAAGNAVAQVLLGIAALVAGVLIGQRL